MKENGLIKWLKAKSPLEPSDEQKLESVPSLYFSNKENIYTEIEEKKDSDGSPSMKVLF